MPSIQQRKLARRVAIDAWTSGLRDMGDLQAMFRRDERIVKLDPFTIIVLIKLAIALWQWWAARRIDKPSSVPLIDEPQ